MDAKAAAFVDGDGAAERDGPHGVREFAERDMSIALQFRRGVTAKSLAQTHNITPTRVRQIVKLWEDWDPQALVGFQGGEAERIDRMVQMAEQTLEDAVIVFARAAKTGNVNWQVGALRRRQDAFDRLLSVWRAAGLLPANLRAPGREQALLELVAKLIDLVRQRGDEELATTLLRLAQAHASQGGPPLIEAAVGAAA